MKNGGSVTSSLPDEIALSKLGQLYRLARIRYSLLVLIPALWVGGVLAASLSGPINGLTAGILIAWFFIVLFGIGAWVFLIIPEKEEVKRKYVSHVLPYLFAQEGLTIDYYPSHDLQMKTFLQSGLFHDDYQTMLREDCIQGSASKMKFSMYQVAVQTLSRVTGRYGNSARLATNMFYGWAIHAIIPRIPGTHVIIPKGRKTNDESDDWVEKVHENWWSNPRVASTETGYVPFDALFTLYTDQPAAFFSVGKKEFLDFVIYLANTSTNAFAINMSGSVFALHIGHEKTSFRHMPDGNFATEYNPELLEEVKWFAQMLKDIQRFTSQSSSKP